MYFGRTDNLGVVNCLVSGVGSTFPMPQMATCAITGKNIFCVKLNSFPIEAFNAWPPQLPYDIEDEPQSFLVSISVAAAVCRWLEVDLRQDGRRYLARFEDGHLLDKRLRDVGPARENKAQFIFESDPRYIRPEPQSFTAFTSQWRAWYQDLHQSYNQLGSERPPVREVFCRLIDKRDAANPRMVEMTVRR
jgi:hypothetical protein